MAEPELHVPLCPRCGDPVTSGCYPADGVCAVVDDEASAETVPLYAPGMSALTDEEFAAINRKEERDEITRVDLELLADVQACRVADNDDNVPILDLGPDGELDVRVDIWRFKERGWVHDGEWPAWRLTPLGEDVLAGRHP